MGRLTAIAAFALLLAVPLWAQRGGGRAGGHGGGMSGHSGFNGGHAGSTHGFGGMHAGPGVGSRGFSHVPSSRSGFSSRAFSSRGSHHRGPVVRNRGFNRCFGCRRGFGFGYAYPWGYGGYYDPYWYWDHSSSYDDGYERDRATANEMNRQSLEEQRMRPEDDQDLYAQSAPLPPREAAREAERTDATPATVLVFRDQRKQEVQNYAIVGQTLWNFVPQRTQKIALADLDLAATSKANDARGVDFRVPAASEGQ